jgi:hypothetical protein
VVVAGCLIALATPSPAEGWIKLYRRLSEQHQLDTDRDDIVPPPNFGFDFNTGQWVTIRVPDALRDELISAGGRRYDVRRNGEVTTVDLPRDTAAELLRHPAWRDLNQKLVAELIPEGTQ